MLRQRTAEVRGLSVWHLAAKPFANKIVGLQHPPAVSKPQVNLEAFFLSESLHSRFRCNPVLRVN